MIRRVARLAIWSAAALASLTPEFASANQVKLKGYLFTRPAVVKDTTGNCQCVWKWYTVGLQPGPVRLTVTLRGDGPVEAPTYAVLVSFLRDGTSIKDAQVSCDAQRRDCGKHVTVTVPIKIPGVYYISVHGEGSSIIAYSLGLRGNVYPLRCKTYCR